MTDERRPDDGMIVTNEDAFRAELKRAYECGVTEARAAFSRDLRILADDFVTQLHELRCEIRKDRGTRPCRFAQI